MCCLRQVIHFVSQGTERKPGDRDIGGVEKQLEVQLARQARTQSAELLRKALLSSSSVGMSSVGF